MIFLQILPKERIGKAYEEANGIWYVPANASISRNIMLNKHFQGRNRSVVKTSGANQVIVYMLNNELSFEA